MKSLTGFTRSLSVAGIRKFPLISHRLTLVASNGERCTKALIINSFTYRTDSLNP